MFYITDKQTDKIISFIPKNVIRSANHVQDLSNYSEILKIEAVADGKFAEYLGERNRIVYQTEDGEFRELRIENAYQYHDEFDVPTVEIEAVGSYADLITAKHIPKGVTEAWTATQHANAAVSGTEWRINTIASTNIRTLRHESPTNPFAYLTRIANEFELELKFSITIEGNRIVDRYIDLVEKIGDSRGKRVVFGKDLQGVEREEQDGNIVTALFGYGPEDPDGNQISVFVEDLDALNRWGRNGSHIVDYHDVVSDNTEMTEEEVRRYTRTELNKRINASVFYTIRFANLEEVPGLEHEATRLGDTIFIKDEAFSPPLYLEARVFRVETNPINPREKKVEIGDFTVFTREQVDSIWERLQKEIAAKISRTELIQYAEPVIPEQDTPPSNPKKGDKWVDTSENPPQLKLYDGNEWHAVKGEKGDRGEPGKDGYTPIKGVDYFDGKDGQDGTSSYLWVRYSQNANGNPMSPDPTNAKYIGVATTETPSAPSSYTDYDWTLIKGSDGIPGEDGEDGRTSYLHIKYSNDGGQTFTGNNGEDVGEWIGTYVDFTQADSNNPSDYTWNKVKGEKGDKGDTGPRGATGERGPRGDAGTSVTGVTEYYLASSASSGVTTGTSGWTTSMQQMTPSKKYLWNYEKIHFSDNTTQNTLPVIIGVYGDKGDEGDTGRSIVSIEERYLATSASSGVTRSTSGWTSNMQQTTTSKRYLWNYEIITWNKAPLTTYIEPIIIGVHGETGPKGDKGDQGPQGIQGPKGEDGQSQYVHIRYSANANGNPMTTTPQSNSKYIGLANTTSPTAPSSYSVYTWSLIRGADGQDGIPGPKGDDGQTTYTWVRYADDENGSGMSDSPHDKLYIGLAFNKTTPTESNNPSDYTWSLMPQNIEIGGRNLATINSVGKWGNGTFNRVDYKYILKNSNGNTNIGLYIDRSQFENSTDYVVSFKVKKISGTVNSMAGHRNGYNEKVYKDGVLIEGVTWTSGDQNYNDSDEVHEYTVYFRTLSDAVESSNQPFYIQPNRSAYGESFEVEIWDLQLEKGNKATDWTPAPEDVQAEIDEAKGIAEQAQQSADGKNTVYRQSSTPPTTNRKTGDLWFKTNEGNKMFVWTGSWTPTQLDYQALAVGKLSAISADLGDVTAGNIRGVKIEGSELIAYANQYGTITIKDGLFRAVSKDNSNTYTEVQVNSHLIGIWDTNDGGATHTKGSFMEPGEISLSDSGYSSDIKQDVGWMLIDSENIQFLSNQVMINNNQVDSIVSQGSNSNGNYIRYANGIQMCWHEMSSTSISSGRISYTWTLPAAFQGTNYFANVSLVSGSQYLNNGFTVQRTSTSTIFRGVGVTASMTFPGLLFAIGRWR